MLRNSKKQYVDQGLSPYEMCRSTHSSKAGGELWHARFLGAVPIFLVLIFSQVTWAQGPVTDLEATILRIGGSAITGTNAIPAGRSLTPVQLTTSDPETNDLDGLSLGGAVPGFRVRGGARVPAVPAEQVIFRIDGTTVATSVPDMRATLLQTNAGPVTAVVFTTSGVTYAIPRTEFSAATQTVAPSTVNSNTVSTLFTYQYGLLPVGALPRVGSAFSENSSFGVVGSVGTERFTVLDADDIRGNSDSLSEELVVPGEPALTYGRTLGSRSTEVLTIVRLSDGSLLELLGVRYTRFGAYSYVENTWLFERATLASVGATIDDVSDVVLDTPVDHGLTWQELGFDFE